jgi:hypothetical protein
MAVQIVTPGPFPGTIDLVATLPLGTTAQDEFGNEYIYLQGVAGTLVGDAVVYNNLFVTARTAVGSIGPVAFATAAILALQFGWYQIRGDLIGNGAAALVANNRLQTNATAGALATTAVAGQTVYNCFSRAATGGAGPAEMRCAYPFTIAGAP